MRNEKGAAAAEYALLVAVVIVAITTAVSQFDLGNLFEVVVTKVATAVG